MTRTLLVAIGVFVASSAAQAGAPTAADRVTARQLMLEGRALRHNKDLRGALERFRAADALMRVPTTGLEVARTEAELGMLVEALDTCARVLRHPATPDEPEPFREARSEARKLQAELRQRTPSLRFILPANEDTNGVELRVDGILIPGEARQVPRLVNPGKHDVETIAGSNRRIVTVTVEEGQSRDVVVTLPQRASVRKAPAPAAGDGPNPWVWGGFTTAAVAGTIGVAAGALAWSERRGLDDACPSRTCAADDTDRLDRAYRYADVSTYAFIVGGIGASVGIGALLYSRRDKPDTEAGARVVPCRGGTLCLNGTF